MTYERIEHIFDRLFMIINRVGLESFVQEKFKVVGFNIINLITTFFGKPKSTSHICFLFSLKKKTSKLA